MRISLLIFFFLSGACGLIYEIVWIKLFAFALGSTTHAISAVVASFMGGLAIGSWFAGKWIDRRGDPLLIYGIIEAVVGLYALIVPSLIRLIPSLIGPLYDDHYASSPVLFGALRLLLSAPILLIPTILMGASLPVLAKYYIKEKNRFGREVGRLFAINTFGACVGSFMAGFVILPYLGKSSAIHISAAINVGIGVVVAIYRLANPRKEDSSTSTLRKDEPAKTAPDSNISSLRSPDTGLNKGAKRLLWAALLLYAANGFAGMAYQVAWTRALTLCLGSSAYSFTIIVTVFIFGLALGGTIASSLVDRIRNVPITMAWVEIAIGFISLWAMWGLGQSPKWMTFLIRKYFGDWGLLVGIEFALTSLLLLTPTLLMGMVFPLAVKTVSSCRTGTAGPVGLAYGWNTAGAIFGSLTAGFILLPSIGLQNTIASANLINWLAGAVMLFVAGSSRLGKRILIASAPVAAGIIFTVAMPQWDPGVMNSGPAIYAKLDPEKSIFLKKENIIYNKDDADVTVLVQKMDEDFIFLRINGKTDASSNKDMQNQILIAQIPLLAHKAPKSVCVIGLASGVTAGSAASFPVDSIDVIELSKRVIEASDFFRKWNNNVRDDPRVKIIVGDGRNHLLMTQKKYDVIVSEPSNPWQAGESSLFTREYFELGKNKLNEGGIFSCWVQGYELNLDELRMVMLTFKSVFPYASFWQTFTGVDYALIGAAKPFKFSLDNVENRFKDAKIAADLKKAHIGGSVELFAKFIFGADGFDKINGSSEYHIDDRLQLEYTAPRNMFLKRDYYSDIYENIIVHRRHPREIIEEPESSWPTGFAESLDKQVWANTAADDVMYFLKTGDILKSFDAIKRTISLNPANTYYKKFVFSIAEASWKYVSKNGIRESDIHIFQEAAELCPENAEIGNYLAAAYISTGRIELAKIELQKSLKTDPKNCLAIGSLGYIEESRGNLDKAMEIYQSAVDLDIDCAAAYIGLGEGAFMEKDYRSAEKYLFKAVDIDPESVAANVSIGRFLIVSGVGDKSKGIKYIRKAIEINPALKNDPELIKLIQ